MGKWISIPRKEHCCPKLAYLNEGIAAAVGVGKSSVSRIMNQPNKFGIVHQNGRINIGAKKTKLSYIK